MTTPTLGGGRAAFLLPASWKWRPSPNHNARPKAVSALVLHADAASRVESALDWIRRAESKVSYHVLIGRVGEVYAVVNPDRRAWHAGQSLLAGVENVNDFSVGVCLSNRNDGVEQHPGAQVSAAADVCAILCRHYGIPVSRIVTHAQIAPGRKTDPVALDLNLFREYVAARLVA